MPSFDVYNRTQTSTSGGITPDVLPTGGGEVTALRCIRTAFAAAGQDVAVFPTAGAPLKMRILDVFVDITTGNASETLTIRDASGGSGNALSSALTLASTGRVREGAPTATVTLAAGGNLFFRRNTTTAVGSVVILFEYEL